MVSYRIRNLLKYYPRLNIIIERDNVKSLMNKSNQQISYEKLSADISTCHSFIAIECTLDITTYTQQLVPAYCFQVFGGGEVKYSQLSFKNISFYKGYFQYPILCKFSQYKLITIYSMLNTSYDNQTNICVQGQLLLILKQDPSWMDG